MSSRGCGRGSCGRDRVALPARVWVKSCVGVWRQLVAADVGWLERARCGSWSRNVQQQQQQGSASPASQLAAVGESERRAAGSHETSVTSSPPRLLLCLPALQFQPPTPCTFVSGTQTLLCGFHSLIFSVAFIKLLTTWTQMNERMGMICIRSLLSQTVSFVRNNGLCLFAAGRILRP